VPRSGFVSTRRYLTNDRERAPRASRGDPGGEAPRIKTERGLTLIEMMFSLAIAGTAIGIAIPMFGDALDEMRTMSAARYVAARINAARVDAVRHSRSTALRFEPFDATDGEGSRDYSFVPVADGNGNGVRSADIRDGIDTVTGPAERLRDKFPRVRFELMPGLPDADDEGGTGEDGVRIGSGRILTMSLDGTATSGTLYIRGRRSQYAVRVLGVTGRTRLLHYQPHDRTWMNR
jgi:prepilin-type N-terminal cleavage/methylation domain-containing protein